MRMRGKSSIIALPLFLILTAGVAMGDGLDSRLIDLAGSEGDAASVRALLDAGANVNARGGGETPVLMFAVLNNVEVVRVLLDRGAEVNAPDVNGKTALHDAAFWGKGEIAELLIARGAEVNAKNIDGETPLAIAAYKGERKIAELLIAKGAEVNCKDNLKKTPLHSAAYQGNKEVVDLLVARGADVNAETDEGLPALSFTCVQDAEIVNRLRGAGAKGTPELCNEDYLFFR